MTATDVEVRSAPVIAAAVTAAVATALPGFLVGALAVQVRAEFDVSAARYGWAMSGYFLAATTGSVLLGRLAQRIGPRRQLVGALFVAAIANVLVAAAAQSFGALVALLAVAGLCNAGCQTAVNLALTQAALPRLGLAIAIKQSGMPSASMLAGIAVPALALTVGWRWAFVAVAGITVVAAVIVARAVAPPTAPASVIPKSHIPELDIPNLDIEDPRHHNRHHGGPRHDDEDHDDEDRNDQDHNDQDRDDGQRRDGQRRDDEDRAGRPNADARSPETGSSTAALVGAAVACAFLAFGAGTLNAWVVSSGVDAGLGEGAAGLMLSGGAALGIAIRLGWGFRLDSLDLLPFRVGGLMALVGSVGVALLAVRSVPVHLVATVIGFAGGWIWPVFTNFGVIRANVGRAAAATGVSQTGVYVGVFVAPLLTGVLIEHVGYGPMWLVTAAAMGTGSVIAIRIAHHF